MPARTVDPELAFLATAQRAHQANDASVLNHQLVTSPLVTYSAFKQRAADFPSRGLLGTSENDERVYLNTNTPSTAVVCGVQGSGKSHTVSCILECALIPDARVGQLPQPLSALVFHFDTQDTGRPCEAAFLSSPGEHKAAVPQVTVLCSPSNVNRRRRAYASLGRVRVEAMTLSERDLTADRMLALMGCDDLERIPLYMHIVLHIIRDMGVDGFSYLAFKQRVAAEQLDFKQRAMINLRLDLLDAFVRPSGAAIDSYFTPGGLVLVDLTDPFLDSITATVLFDIVLGTFTQWQTSYGKLVVLDEAHKYLVNSDSARLTQSLTDIIRLQRHLATRIVIATQEPTVVPSTILDLAAVIVCHRFSSPAWAAHLAKHVSSAGSGKAEEWQTEVMLLATGDALVFAPAAAVTAGVNGEKVQLLGREHLTLRVRPRLTLDGGASLLAVQSSPSTPSSPSTSSSAASSSSPSSASSSASASSSSTSSSRSSSPPMPDLNFKTKPEAPSTVSCQSEAASSLKPKPKAGALSTASFKPEGSSSSASSPPSRAPRLTGAHFRPLLEWLISKGGANGAPLSLAAAATDCVISPATMASVYPTRTQQDAWKRLLRRIQKAGLVELVHMDVEEEVLKARGKERLIRLVDPGPFKYI
ncbi:hypothetical protein C8R46DRAFT_1191598 [Mycena filopes]|nr:hypothetical protein C8R46DRAFT_1191598 [Mycena filopes]